MASPFGIGCGVVNQRVQYASRLFCRGRCDQEARFQTKLLLGAEVSRIDHEAQARAQSLTIESVGYPAVLRRDVGIAA
jgi:hypothetical protein